jgi:hypothetical protein
LQHPDIDVSRSQEAEQAAASGSTAAHQGHINFWEDLERTTANRAAQVCKLQKPVTIVLSSHTFRSDQSVYTQGHAPLLTKHHVPTRFEVIDHARKVMYHST